MPPTRYQYVVAAIVNAAAPNDPQATTQQQTRVYSERALAERTVMQRARATLGANAVITRIAGYRWSRESNAYARI